MFNFGARALKFGMYIALLVLKERSKFRKPSFSNLRDRAFFWTLVVCNFSLEFELALWNFACTLPL